LKKVNDPKFDFGGPELPNSDEVIQNPQVMSTMNFLTVIQEGPRFNIIEKHIEQCLVEASGMEVFILTMTDEIIPAIEDHMVGIEKASKKLVDPFMMGFPPLPIPVSKKVQNLSNLYLNGAYAEGIAGYQKIGQEVIGEVEKERQQAIRRSGCSTPSLATKTE
jgi:hypothetical protein